jgi:alpha-amylase
MQNLTLFQFFHWYYSPEGNLWQHAKEKAEHLSSLGITHVWLPPAYKSAYGTEEPGYAVYDLYDLGEFDQKGTIRTRYGTRQQYQDCINTFHDQGLQVLADIVLNHKLGADETEKVPVRKVDSANRNEFVTEEEQVDLWTKFTFPGRKGKYSRFIWDWHSFTGISENPENIYLIHNEHTNGQWEKVPSGENGNYDYLMGADVEFRNAAVRKELKKWGRWYMKSTGIDGLRLDAVKHIPHQFFNEWLDYLKSYFKKDFLCIAEYWSQQLESLLQYVDMTEGRMQLFDVPLHYNFHKASVSESEYDISKILENTLLQHRPDRTITFVDNHDTQPLQALQSPVDFWFRPLAYALILLREQGIPCVFYPSMYEAKYIDKHNEEDIYVELNSLHNLEQMLLVRKELAYGFQRDYFDHPNTIGWTREGTDEKERSGCAVVLTNGTAGTKTMEVGKKHAGKLFVDIAGAHPEKVTINEEGFGDFYVAGKSVSVWIAADALRILY